MPLGGVKQVALQALSRAGFEVRRTKHLTAARKDRCLRANFVVEMIGPSGVGKSSLLRALKADLGDAWLTREELPSGIGLRETSLHSRLFNAKLTEIASVANLAINEKRRIIEWYGTVLAVDQECLRLLPLGSILDEGLFVNFGTVLGELLNADPAWEFEEDLLEMRAVIHLFASPEAVLARLRHREQYEGPRIFHRKLSDEALLSRIEETNASRARLTTLLEARGVPILHLDAEAPVRRQVDAAAAFLDRLVRSERVPAQGYAQGEDFRFIPPEATERW